MSNLFDKANNWFPGQLGDDGRRIGDIKPIPKEVVIETIVLLAIKISAVEGREDQYHKCEFSRTHGYLDGRWGSDWRETGANVEEGYWTSTGRFVDRKEAFSIACAAGQVKNPENCNGILHSTDLF